MATGESVDYDALISTLPLDRLSTDRESRQIVPCWYLQVPMLPAMLQASQSPPQARSQQTPSAHWPSVH